MSLPLTDTPSRPATLTSSLADVLARIGRGLRYRTRAVPHPPVTPLAEERTTQVGNAGEAALARALETLDATDLLALEAAVPAMKRLSKAISRSEVAQQ